MFKKTNLWYKSAALILILALIVPMLAACGDDDDDDNETTTPVSTEPVKIGFLSAWTGPQAGVGQLQDQSIALVLEMVNENGGILGGRMVEVERGDTASQVANALSQGKRLILSEKITAIAGAGVSPPEIDGVVSLSDEYKIPTFSWGGEPADLTNHPYVVRMNNLTVKQKAEAGARVAKMIGATTVAFMAEDTAEYRAEGAQIKTLVEANGAEMKQVQYIPWDATDLSPYLTKLRAAKPDVVIIDFAAVAKYMTMWKQMPGLGGWDDIKPVCVSAAAGYSVGQGGADGVYFVLNWTTSSPDTEGNRKFVSAFHDKYGEYPNTSHMQTYEILTACIMAIDQAGSTDAEAIRALIRSGKWTYEVAQGPVSISAAGEHSLEGFLTQFFADKGFVVVNH